MVLVAAVPWFGKGSLTRISLAFMFRNDTERTTSDPRTAHAIAGDMSVLDACEFCWLPFGFNFGLIL